MPPKIMTSWTAYDPFCPPPYLQSPNPRRRPPWQTTRALVDRARLPTQTLSERNNLLRLLQFKITQKRCRLGRERQNASLHCCSQLALVNWKSLSEKKRQESKEGEVERCDRALEKNRNKVLQLETELAKIVLSARAAPLPPQITPGSEARFEHAKTVVMGEVGLSPRATSASASAAKLEHAKNMLMADAVLSPRVTAVPQQEGKAAPATTPAPEAMHKHAESMLMADAVLRKSTPTAAAPKLEPCSICQEDEAESLCVTCSTPICVWCGHWYGASYPSICDECYPESRHLMCKNSARACENSARGKCSLCSALVCYECGVWKDPEVWCLDCRG